MPTLTNTPYMSLLPSQLQIPIYPTQADSGSNDSRNTSNETITI